MQENFRGLRPELWRFSFPVLIQNGTEIEGRMPAGLLAFA
jgi:hypothetical protein